MKRKDTTTRYTANDIDEKLARGESRSDWERVKAMSEEELEAAIAQDEDADISPVDWSTAVPHIPPPKQYIHIGLDRDIVEWFRARGHGYQTRINAVLRSYLDAQHTEGPHDR